MIRTFDLQALLAERKPLVIDTMLYNSGHSIVGAVGLKYSGVGGDMFDQVQDRLRRKLRALAGDDLTRPIVVLGFNSEHFDGRNLALRLVAIGYPHVYWYRGGREAWEAQGLPETEVNAQVW